MINPSMTLLLRNNVRRPVRRKRTSSVNPLTGTKTAIIAIFTATTDTLISSMRAAHMTTMKESARVGGVPSTLIPCDNTPHIYPLLSLFQRLLFILMTVHGKSQLKTST